MIYSLIRPLLFGLDPETAHGLALRWVAGRRAVTACPPMLATTVAGVPFPSPIGLAAGCDKDGLAVEGWFALGFGSVEIGTLTPRPQAGNPRPRLFRLVEDRAVINRMGFNNGGQLAAIERLSVRRPGRRGVLGINIGANKETVDRIADYTHGVRAMAPYADYLTINISSPNTPGLRGLQQADALSELLGAMSRARMPGGPPVFLKVAPDLDDAAVADIVALCLDQGIDAVIMGNTTIARPPLHGPRAGEAGGLSGAPLAELALDRLRAFRAASRGRLPLIAAGGIASGADAWQRIRAGASLVQLYSALVYQGPGLIARMNRELVELMTRDGFANVADAVGVDQ